MSTLHGSNEARIPRLGSLDKQAPRWCYNVYIYYLPVLDPRLIERCYSRLHTRIELSLAFEFVPGRFMTVAASLLIPWLPPLSPSFEDELVPLLTSCKSSSEPDDELLDVDGESRSRVLSLSLCLCREPEHVAITLPQECTRTEETVSSPR